MAALSEYETGPFSEREKIALRYADQMSFDHQLRAQFNREAILELSWVIGEFISLGKIIYVLGVPYGEHTCGTVAGESE